MLFENFYYDSLNVSNRVYRKLVASDLYPYDENKVTVDDITVEGMTFEIYFVYDPQQEPKKDMQSSFAYLLYHSTNRQTVNIGSRKVRRKLPGDVARIHFNVANLIMHKPEEVPFYAELKPHIRESDAGVFTFNKVPQDKFIKICNAVMDLPRFKSVLAHEVQHIYGPTKHKFIPKTRKVNKKDVDVVHNQTYTNYINSNDEIDSSVVEAVKYITSREIGREALVSGDVNLFVKSGMQYIRQRYPEAWISLTAANQRKIITKITLVFNKMMAERSKATQPS